MKYILFFSMACFIFFISFSGFAQETHISVKDKSELAKLFPADVAIVLENSCFQCHTAGSKNADAKKELNFNEWKNYSVIKKIGKLKEVCKNVTDGKMPPEKYLAKFPHKKLSDDEIKLLCNWVKTESENLVKGLN